ncbi:MAG: AAA family ATPase [Coriobacteriia bacterium]|nr:AAA family ATPase [Coriobacteriia bacterium]
MGRLPVVRNLRDCGGFDFTHPVTVFVGENGVGKSTLVEALAVRMGFNPEGGTVNFNFATHDSHSRLAEYLRVLRGIRRHRDGFFLRAESFYNVASNIDDLDAAGGIGRPVVDSYGGVSLHAQSHGESFMALVENRFGGRGLYILDEPEAALSPMRVMRLMALMKRLVDADSQFVVSTHSPMLMAFPGADVVEIGDDGMRRVDYRDTEHYQVMLHFLENPEQMLAYLLDE